MPTFRRGDVVRVAFPYTDGRTTQRRPALVVSDGAVGDASLLLWVVMITSAQNRPWRGDVAIDPLAGTGLASPSVVRPAKLATIEASRAEAIGRISDRMLDQVDRRIDTLLGRGSPAPT